MTEAAGGAAATGVAGTAPSLRARLLSLRGGSEATARSSPAPPSASPPHRADARAAADRPDTLPLRVERARLAATALHGRRPLSALARVAAEARAHDSWERHARAMWRSDVPLDALPAGALFIDTETTGLSGGAGTLAWLVGMAWAEPSHSGGPDTWVVEQLVLQEMATEAQLLREVARRIEAARLLVSFNGKAFDLPLLATRHVLQRVPAPPERPHLDLLHPARRVFGSSLATVRLQALEAAVLGVERDDDIPSDEVPAAWFEYLRTGRTDDVDRVVEHNRVDVLSLVGLAAALLELAVPARGPSDRDVLGTSGTCADPLEVADQRWRAGDRAGAAAWFAAAEGPALAGDAGRRGLRKARTAKRVLGRRQAERAWREALGTPGAGTEPSEELAKLLEHDAGDLRGARDVVRAALERWPEAGEATLRLRHRLARLERRLEAADRGTSGRRRPQGEDGTGAGSAGGASASSGCVASAGAPAAAGGVVPS